MATQGIGSTQGSSHAASPANNYFSSMEAQPSKSVFTRCPHFHLILSSNSLVMTSAILAALAIDSSCTFVPHHPFLTAHPATVVHSARQHQQHQLHQNVAIC
ncbi:hypothetical protein NL676_033518 [Syzygium grande]|nr:hypothetical protein NL676_033518 [Syzygium grande]